MPTRIFRPTTLAVVCLLSCWGCGSSAETRVLAPTVPVKGKVTYQGKPLTKGVISFEPKTNGRTAEGEIQPDGSFELSTFKKGDGATVDTHRISVTNTGLKLPKKYNDPSSSKVEVQVTEGKTDYPVDLK